MKIILMMVMTSDGIVTKSSHTRVDWSSREDKKSFVMETKKHGAIIMGSKTFETLSGPLPHRLNLVLTHSPEKYREKTIPGTLEFINGDPKEVITYLENKKYASAVLAGGPKTNASFLQQGLVDELLLTIEPKLFGSGLTLANGADLEISLELLEIKTLNHNTLQLRYKILNRLSASADRF